jgi:hypothetical protein
MNVGDCGDILVQVAKDQRDVRSIESGPKDVMGCHGVMTFLRNLRSKGSV